MNKKFKLIFCSVFILLPVIIVLIVDIISSLWIINSNSSIDTSFIEKPDFNPAFELDLESILTDVDNDYSAVSHAPEIDTDLSVLTDAQKKILEDYYDITYIYSDGTTSTIAPTNAGDYTARYFNTETHRVTEIEFVINKINPTITAPSESDFERVYYNPTICDTVDKTKFSAKGVNSKTVSGDFSFSQGTIVSDGVNNTVVKDGDTVVRDYTTLDGQTLTITYTFISDDSNYNDVIGSIEIPLYSVAVNNSTYYARIETALSSASNTDTIKIVVGSNPIIYGNQYDEENDKYFAIINSGVTLFINYGSETKNNTQATVNSNGVKKIITSGNILTGQTFTQEDYDDKDQDPNIVTISNDVILYNNGTLNIGGKLAAGPNGPRCGHTSTDYSIILMKSNSKLVSTGALNCQGFILESCDDLGCNNLPYINGPYTVSTCSSCLNNGSELIVDNGEFSLPFIVKDMGDGNTLAAFNNAIETGYTTPPFNQFTFENVTVTTRINYLAQVKTLFSIYSPRLKQFASATAYLISRTEKALIKLADKGYLNVKNKNGIIHYDFFGGGEINSLNLSVSGLGSSMTVDTEKTYLPLSWQFIVSFNSTNNNSTTYKVDQTLKLMPGSKVIVNENTRVECSSLAIYDNSYIDSSSGVKGTLYPSGKSSAKLEVSGELIADNIGGSVYSTSKNSKVEVSNKTTVTSYEALTRSGASTDSVVTKWDQREISLAMPINSSTNRSIKGEYVSTENSFTLDNKTYYYWTYYEDYVISFNTGNSEIEIPNVIKEKVYQGNGGFVDILETDLITSDEMNLLVTENYPGHSFVNWYYLDSNGNKIYDLIGFDFNGNIVIYAEFKTYTYLINYSHGLANNDEIDFTVFENVVINNPITSYTADSNEITLTEPVLPDTYKDQYNFAGWYIDSEFLNPIAEFNGKDFVEGLPLEENSVGCTLYGKWRPADVTQYKVHYQLQYTGSKYTFNDSSPASFISESIDDFTNQTYNQLINKYNSSDSSSFYIEGWYIDSGLTSNISDDFVNSVKSLLSKSTEVYIYVKIIDKYKVTYENDKEYYYYGNFVTKQVDESSDYISRYLVYKGESTDPESELYLTGTQYDISSDLTLIQQTYWLLDISVTYSESKISSTEAWILETSESNRCDNSSDIINSNTSTTTFTRYVLSGKEITITPGYVGDDSQSCKVDGTNITTTPIKASITAKTEITIYSKKKSSICIVEGTLITMADGSQKKVEDLKNDDLILAFNHEIGKLEIMPLLFNAHAELPKANYLVLKLEFSNGNSIEIAGSHEFFDYDLLEYVSINIENVDNYLGHKFYTNSSNNIDKLIELQSYKVYEKECTIYSPASVYHLNFFANDILMMPAIPNDYNGWFNYFELGYDMKYDEYKMSEDIEVYGLFTYEEFIEFIGFEISIDTFNALPAKYFKVSLGKGLTTKEEIIYVLRFALDIDVIE